MAYVCLDEMKPVDFYKEFPTEKPKEDDGSSKKI